MTRPPPPPPAPPPPPVPAPSLPPTPLEVLQAFAAMPPEYRWSILILLAQSVPAGATLWPLILDQGPRPANYPPEGTT